MSSFRGAHDFIINNSQFTHVQAHILTGSSGIDVLREASNPEATYDSAARSPPPSCFPGTRKQYVEDITHWAIPSLRGDALPPIYWMSGPAGVGKSAVAQTCVERLKDAGQLGAAFFFSINGRDDHKCLFTSIAYQLSTEFRTYRDVVDEKVYHDKTLVTKAMASQFTSLIVEPLRELERRGRDIPPVTIFIDGLDECQSKSAQCEIIEIVATSVRDHTTPFRWAFFSRPEPHINATFSRADISALCWSTFLPVSREVDGEIKLYLRHGFENIIRRRNLLIPRPWPSDKQLQLLVDASSGLFVYPAAVLRFVDQSLSLDPEETLDAVLDIITRSEGISSANPSQQPVFAELDNFYKLLLQRIPSPAFASVQLFFAVMFLGGFHFSWTAAHLSNLLRFNEVKFTALCNELHAVLYWGRSLGLKGEIHLYHKSFYDFLQDPARSGPFCVSTQRVKEIVFNHLLELHLDLSRSYHIEGPNVILAPGIPSAAASLSWPQETEIENSHLKVWIYEFATGKLIYPNSISDISHLSYLSLQKLQEVDYSKLLMLQLPLQPEHLVSSIQIFLCWGFVKRIGSILFYCVPPEEFDMFDTKGFYQMLNLYQELKIIESYFSDYGESHRQLKRGLYVFGQDKKRHFWYWEINTKEKCYYEFETTDSEEAERLYREKEFKLSDWFG